MKIKIIIMLCTVCTVSTAQPWTRANITVNYDTRRASIHGLATNNDTIYAGGFFSRLNGISNAQNIAMSSDGGNNWEAIVDSSASLCPIIRMSPMPEDTGIIICSDSIAYGSINSAEIIWMLQHGRIVHMPPMLGISIVPYTHLTINDVAVVKAPGSSDSVWIYAATETGLLRYNASAAPHWQRVNMGMPLRPLYASSNNPYSSIKRLEVRNGDLYAYGYFRLLSDSTSLSSDTIFDAAVLPGSNPLALWQRVLPRGMYTHGICDAAYLGGDEYLFSGLLDTLTPADPPTLFAVSTSGATVVSRQNELPIFGRVNGEIYIGHNTDGLPPVTESMFAWNHGIQIPLGLPNCDAIVPKQIAECGGRLFVCGSFSLLNDCYNDTSLIMVYSSSIAQIDGVRPAEPVLSVWPVPGVEVRVDSDVPVSVYDLRGRLVIVLPAGRSTLHGLAAGTYFARSSNSSAKIIIID